MFDENKFIYSIIKILNKQKVPSEKIHLQKFISYLSDSIRGVPFNFSIYTYGPFCKDLSAKLTTLVAWGDLYYKNESYVIPENVSEFLDPTEEALITQELTKFVDKLPCTDFRNMELYGTMHYYMTRTKPINKNLVIEKFKAAKQDKFSDADIEICFEQLVSLFN